jgi:hypothetical protein
MLSSVWFTGVCSLNANVSEHCLFHLHRWVGMYLPAYEDGRWWIIQKKAYNIQNTAKSEINKGTHNYLTKGINVVEQSPQKLLRGFAQKTTIQKPSVLNLKEQKEEVMGRQGRRCLQLLGDLKEVTGYWKLNEEELDCVPWRTGFGKSMDLL